MSLLLRNELRLRVGSGYCEAALWRRGWPGRQAAAVRVAGPPDTALVAALQALAAAGPPLPAAASVCVEDELLYYTLFPADGPWQAAPARARALFAGALGDAPLRLVTQLAPGQRHWVSVAIDDSLVEAWRLRLADCGIVLRSLQAALFEDLWQRRAELPVGNVVLVLLRQHGAMLVGLRAGALQAINWERCSLDDPEGLGERVRAFGERLALDADDAAAPDTPDALDARSSTSAPSAQAAPPAPSPWPVCLLPDDASQGGRFAALAAAQRWQTLAARQAKL